MRGRLRDRHGRLARVAMDAAASARCRPRGRKRSQRTAKSCGPGAATLASSWREVSRWRRWQERPLTGESTKQTVRPLRGESRVVSAVPVVLPPCFSLHGDYGRSRRPAFPAPLCPENLAECANGRLRTNRPLLELSPLRPKAIRACNRARDSSGVFLNPNSCKGFEPEPSKEGSG